jgi:hypothetical protein
MFCIRALVHTEIKLQDVIKVYGSVIHLVLEYACPTNNPGLIKQLSKEIKCIQKWCLDVVFPKLFYSTALNKPNLIV